MHTTVGDSARSKCDEYDVGHSYDNPIVIPADTSLNEDSMYEPDVTAHQDDSISTAPASSASTSSSTPTPTTSSSTPFTPTPLLSTLPPYLWGCTPLYTPASSLLQYLQDSNVPEDVKEYFAPPAPVTPELSAIVSPPASEAPESTPPSPTTSSVIWNTKADISHYDDDSIVDVDVNIDDLKDGDDSNIEIDPARDFDRATAMAEMSALLDTDEGMKAHLATFERLRNEAEKDGEQKQDTDRPKQSTQSAASSFASSDSSSPAQEHRNWTGPLGEVCSTDPFFSGAWYGNMMGMFY